MNNDPDRINNDRRTEHDRILRGAAVVTITLLAAGATTPYIESLPAATVQMMQIAVAVGIAYGGQLIATSRPVFGRFGRALDSLEVTNR